MHRGFALSVLVCLSGLCLLSAGCASNTQESQAPATAASEEEAGEPAPADPAAEGGEQTNFGVDMQMEVEEEEETEPVRDSTPPPTRAYRPEDKPVQSHHDEGDKEKPE
jgi:hypothetical protein